MIALSSAKIFSIVFLLNSHGGGQLIESLSHFPLVGSTELFPLMG